RVSFSWMDSMVAVHTKRFGILIPSLEKRLDGRLQVGYAEEDATADGLVVQVSEPPLDKIHPTGACGDEVRHEPRIPFQPGLPLRVLVRPVVVHDQVQRNIAGEFGVEPAQESQKLLVPVSLMAFADDLAL